MTEKGVNDKWFRANWVVFEDVDIVKKEWMGVVY